MTTLSWPLFWKVVEVKTGGLTLVLGGAKSGKSEFAEGLYSRDQRVCYIATGVVNHPDGEMQLRIKRHQARRSAKWSTSERYQGIDDLLKTNQLDGYLLDDATMVVTNLFYDYLLKKTTPDRIDQYLMAASATEINRLRQLIIDNWREIIQAQQQTQQTLVVVSDEVGLGIVPATKQTRILRDLYGEVNQLLAKAADEVYFVISGLPQKIK